VHKGQRHPGLHAAILDPKLFETVQKKLSAQAVRRKGCSTASPPSPQTGRIFDAEGVAMGPTFAYGRAGRRYRYYVSAPLLIGKRPASGPDVIRRVGADALERVLVKRLARLANRPELTAEQLPELVQRLELRRGDTQLVLTAEALFGLDHPELAFDDLQGRLQPGERAVWEGDEAVRVSLPQRMQLRGGRTTLSGVEGARTRIDPGLVAGLRSAHQELAKLSASPMTPGVLLAHASAPATHHRRQLARLAFLAPDLQQMILQGRQPSGLTLRTLLKSELPLAWADQRAWVEGLR
jgi:site-specific DNA recombinase